MFIFFGDKKNCGSGGFTLFEVLAAFAILSIVLYSLYIVFDQASRVIEQGTGSSDQYQNARTVLDQIYKDLSQATISQSGPTPVSGKDTPYLLGQDNTKTIGGTESYNRDSISFSIPVENGFNEIGYYISDGNSNTVKYDYLQRLKTARDSSSMDFTVNSPSDFGQDEKFGIYITDINIEYKLKSGTSTYNEWDSRINSLGGTTATTDDDGKLPASVVITLKTVSRKALEAAGGVPDEGDKSTFVIEVPMTED